MTGVQTCALPIYFRDMFGGRSASYQEVLDEMYRELFIEFKEAGLARGANAIIGARFDFDSISAKSTSMMLGTAQGTAVRIKSIGKDA